MCANCQILLWGMALAAAACSSDPNVLVIEVTPGHETEAFKRDPAITRIDVTVRTPEGDIELGASTAPGGSFELGEVPVDRLIEVGVTGRDAEGTLRARGRSLGVVVGSLVDGTLPVFTQRIGEWARPPDRLGETHSDAAVGVLGERYLMVAGGEALGPSGQSDPAAPAYYDLVALGGSSGAALARNPETMVMGGDGVSALLIDSSGATWVDFDLGTQSDVDPPEGLARFADVAGGVVVEGGDDTFYVVGATRDSEPTAAVLVVEPDRTLRAATLASERRGASATYLAGMGLVVAAGSDTAPGLEVLAPGSSVASVRPFAPDGTMGGAALPRGAGQQILLLAGTLSDEPAPLRVLDASCTQSCTAEALDFALEVELASSQAFAVTADYAIVVGTDSGSGSLTRSFAVDVVAQTVTELALREERAGARALGTPHGLLAVVGGRHPDGTGAYTVEMLAAQ